MGWGYRLHTLEVFDGRAIEGARRSVDDVGGQNLAEMSDALDETATHLLVAVLAAIADAVVIGAVTSLGDGTITGVFAGVVLALSTFVVGLLALIVPRLYMAYVDFHDVGADLSGYSRGVRDGSRSS